MMKRVVLFISIIITSFSSAQDPQYSQFYASPLFLNPAFTSVSLGLRANAIYRSQWNAISNKPFTTFSVSGSVIGKNCTFRSNLECDFHELVHILSS